MSNTLILVRHGKAQTMSEASSDLARTLTPAGREALEQAFPHSFSLVATGASETNLWVSPAVRARETAEVVASVLAVDSAEEKETLFFQDVDGFLDELAAYLGMHDNATLICVGHVPFVEDVAYRLTGSTLDFSVGSVAAVEIASADAADGRASGKLAWFVRGSKV